MDRTVRVERFVVFVVGMSDRSSLLFLWTELVGENQMTRLRKFVDDYSKQLIQIEEALDESLVRTDASDVCAHRA